MISIPARIAINVLSDLGGLVTADRHASVGYLAELLTRRLLVTSGPGGGMIFLLNELVLHALASGLPVRILDNGGSFRKLCHTFDGHYLEYWRNDLWRDTAHTIVVMDLEGVSPKNWRSILDDIDLTPTNMWVLAAEAWMYENNCHRANVISSINLDSTNGGPIQSDVILCGKIKSDKRPECLTEGDFDFLFQQSLDRLSSRWILVDGESREHLLMKSSPKRMDLFA